MRRWLPRLLPLLSVAILAACDNQAPTAIDEDLVPVGPVTVEVRLPWSQFASNLRVLGGFGFASEVGLGFLAKEYEGVLNARTLVHFNAFPTEATVVDSAGTTRTDTKLSFVGGNIMIRFDAEASTNTGPVTVSAERTLVHWDAKTATWQNAVDSIDHRVAWGQPGGGPTAPLSSIGWTKSGPDSVLIRLDSTMVAALADTASALERGVRISLDTPGQRLQIKRITLKLIARPSVRSDTVLALTVNPSSVTFVYTPAPTAPTEGLRVGGVPSWRSILTLGLPATVPGTAAACARVSCPLRVTDERITHVGLVLTTRPTEAPFRPTDSLSIEARSVLAPGALPKSPLGGQLFVDVLGRTIGASLPFAGFAPGTPRTVELAITPFVRNLLRGTSETGGTPSPTLALLSLHCPVEITNCFESRSLTYASFAGPGQSGEPYLRLVLTVSGALELP
ncbi:MAG: hypothetical protein EXR95_04015 [Gemmatimonadetes bacterium]|nr:hypothetical protein [Gemmatimonadota bacterium]